MRTTKSASGIAEGLRIIGWILFALSLICIAAGIPLWLRSEPMIFVAGVSGFISSLLIVAAGHALSCLIMIEQNTRQPNRSLVMEEEKAQEAEIKARKSAEWTPIRWKDFLR